MTHMVVSVKRTVFWNDVIMIPIQREDGSKYFFRKRVPFEKSPQYWEHVEEDGVWNLYYVKRGVSCRLAVYNIGHLTPQSIEAQIHDKDISITDCRHIEENLHTNRCIGKKVISTNNWCVEFDGKSVLAILAVKTKMSYKEVLNIIQNEGGYVDSMGIIHKGTAKNKVVEID